MSVVVNVNQLSSNWKKLASTLPPSKFVKPTTTESSKKPEKLRLTKAVCMDCEMVGIGEMGAENMVARVSIVNQLGQCLYDKYVKPNEPVVDYRTAVSGIRPEDLEKDKQSVLNFSLKKTQKGIPLDVVQKEVSEIIERRILVGHAIHNDLQVLFLSHPKKRIRDTQRYKPFRTLFSGALPSLRALADRVLGIKIQTGSHDSVEDARATMQLYVQHRKDWEKSLLEKKYLTSEEKHRRIRERQKKRKNQEKSSLS